jgi:hypothetical protein
MGAMGDGSAFARHAQAFASMSPSHNTPSARLVLALAAPMFAEQAARRSVRR